MLLSRRKLLKAAAACIFGSIGVASAKIAASPSIRMVCKGEAPPLIRMKYYGELSFEDWERVGNDMLRDGFHHTGTTFVPIGSLAWKLEYYGYRKDGTHQKYLLELPGHFMKFHFRIHHLLARRVKR
jgi:hypothetical protein